MNIYSTFTKPAACKQHDFNEQTFKFSRWAGLYCLGYPRLMRLSTRCYAVTGLSYSAPWFVNAGFIVGDDCTLIVDTGGNKHAAQTIYGYAEAAKSGNQMRVVNTEKHFDHIGGNSYFRDQGVDVYGHHGIARTEAEFHAEIAEFNDGIVSNARRVMFEAKAFFSGTKLINPNRLLAEETTFDLGGCLASVLFTPGHTATNVSVWVENEKVLYTGDCLINAYVPNLDAGGVEDWKIWLRSLQRVEDLEAETVVVGHGPVARGGDVRRMIGTVRSALEVAIARGVSPTAG